jgi:uncharacterized protein YceK
MRLLRSLPLSLLASALLVSLLCSSNLMAQGVAPRVRIVNRIDESNLVTLKGNTHPAANAKNDQGRVSPSLPMSDLILVLSRDAEQQAAFDKFVASQYDSTSPDFHHWLTPEQVGTQFGPSETDIATVTNWLTGHGFAVNEVTKDHMSIRFSGTAAQVESAFHTEIHNLTVKGVHHIANMSDPQIPAALAPAVVGIKALHNFFPRPAHHLGSQVTRDTETGKWKRLASTAPTASKLGSGTKVEAAARSQFGINVTGTYPYLVEDVGPWDFATIYNVQPLWTAGIDGTGQVIAIAGTSDIDVGQSTTETGANGNNDIATFRTFFNLPTTNAANTPLRVTGNSQPLTVCTASDTTDEICTEDDLIENTLDVEWSGSVAKNAQIVLVSSYVPGTSSTDDGLYDSESYIINNIDNSSSPVYGARIMNVSYGSCELLNGTGGNVEYYNLWQTAASEGIAVFVATGDSGSASCDQGGDASGVPYAAEYGLTVSGLASTPYNTAVGGTDFNWCPMDTAFNAECTAAPYWSSTNSATNESNALGYVPETPWNDTCSNLLSLAFLKDFANQEYGITSGISTTEQACNFVLNYSSGFSGSLAQIDSGLLYIVDTVGGSGGASGCVVNSSSSSTTGSCSTGATSTGATTNPDTGATQGAIALYNNGWIKPTWQTGVTGIPSDGVRDIPDVSFFASDGYLSSSAYLICVSEVATCSYDSKSEPFAQEVGGTSVATPAMAGVMALINQKTGASQGNPNAELYKLAAKQTYSNCSAETVTTSSNCYFNDVDTGTNAMPCDFIDGSPNCTTTQKTFGVLDEVAILPGYSAGTGYDQATGLGSLNVANVVNAWPVTVGTVAATVTVTPAENSMTSNQSLSVTVIVASTLTGGVTPTGTVTLSGGGYTSSAMSLSSSGSATFTIPAYALAAGTDTLTGNYSGDVVYAATTGTNMVTVSVTNAITPKVTVTPESSTVDSNATLSVTATVAGPSGSITPAGTVTLTATLSGSSSAVYTSSAETLSGGTYSFTIPANSLNSGSGTYTLAVAYASQDAVYNSTSGTNTVTVTESTYTLTATTPAAIAPGASAISTITVTAVAGYTGTVTLTCQLQSSSTSGGDSAACTIPSTAVSMGGTAVATVTTTAASSAALVYPNVRGKSKGWLGAGSGAVLAFLVFLGIPARRRSWRQILGVLIVMAALGCLSGCGSSVNSGSSSGTSDPGTTAGTYTFKVVATGTPTVTPTVSTTFTVTVN